MRRRTRRELVAPDGKVADDAITNLSAYALKLDVEYHRLDDRLLELVEAESKAEELRAVLRERDQIGAEREAFRRSVAALHEQTRHPDQRDLINHERRMAQPSD